VLHFGSDCDIDDPKFAGFAIQQKPARGLSAKFNHKVLGAREAGSVVAGLRLILEAQQGLALCLRQGSEFGFTGSAEESEQEGFVFGAFRAEMDHLRTSAFLESFYLNAHGAAHPWGRLLYSGKINNGESIFSRRKAC